MDVYAHFPSVPVIFLISHFPKFEGSAMGWHPSADKHSLLMIEQSWKYLKNTVRENCVLIGLVISLTGPEW
jgi:hypothetical protein